LTQIFSYAERAGKHKPGSKEHVDPLMAAMENRQKATDALMVD
jgi:hypothetical protein